LAGAIQAGGEAAGKGLSIIAAQGDIDMQAQAGPAQIASKAALEIKSANGAINFASAKKVTLAVSGGASITIEGGSFTAQCPGKISVKAGKKSMVGGGSVNYTMPEMPNSKLFTGTFVVNDSSGAPVEGQAYIMTLPNGEQRSGLTDAHGKTMAAYSQSEQPIEVTLIDRDEWHHTNVNSTHHEMDRFWN
jgi:uncharacterized protein (DUF2345 family)